MTISFGGCERGPAKPGLVAISGHSLTQNVRMQDMTHGALEAPLFAWVPAVVRSGSVRHSIGQRPADPVEAPEILQRLPSARLLLIQRDSPEGVELVRFSASGDFGGDTWHPTVQEAIDQAAFEFGGSVRDWERLPDDVEDPVVWVTQRLAQEVTDDED